VKRSLFLAFIVWLVAIGFVLIFAGHYAHAGTITAIRTSQVTKSLCIPVKTANLGGSGQPTIANIEADLAYLNPNGIGTGISCVRDASNGNTTYLDDLGALGYKLDLYMGYNPSATSIGSSIISSLSGFNRRDFGGVGAIGRSRARWLPIPSCYAMTCWRRIGIWASGRQHSVQRSHADGSLGLLARKAAGSPPRSDLSDSDGATRQAPPGHSK
jgi:hypothetical protein